jgi:hypothetical protein
LELYADFPLTLIGIAVVFPIVFSINSAYKRREIALSHYASIKAHLRALYFATREWLPETDKKIQRKMKRIIYELFIDLRVMFNTDHRHDKRHERNIYSQFRALSQLVEECRKREMTPGEVSRCNQYISKILIDFENMKHIYQYRTPVTLRVYSKIFIYILPVFYGPYFARLSQNVPSVLIFLIPILFSVILVSLDNIQDQLENPFDLIGEDDVKLHVEKFVHELDD